jgi:hypothetical protein
MRVRMSAYAREYKSAEPLHAAALTRVGKASRETETFIPR